MESAERTEAPIDALDELALADPRGTVRSALDAAREILGMDIAYWSQFTEGHQVVKSVAGDSERFGFGEGTAVPLEQTYCKRMVSGVMPNVIRDARRDEHVRDLDADIGAYVGVPLRLPDGRVHGTLCCVSDEPKQGLDERDVRFLRVLARVLGDHLAREQAPTARPDAKRGVGEEQEGLVATLSLWFAGAPNAAAAARSALAALDEHLDAKCRQNLHLVVTELVTNSVRHSGVGRAGSVGLDVRVRPPRIRVEVTDPGPGFEPEVRPPTPDDLDRVGGWGLFLVDELTDGWGVVRDDLTRVWFEMSVGTDAEAAA